MRLLACIISKVIKWFSIAFLAIMGVGVAIGCVSQAQDAASSAEERIAALQAALPSFSAPHSDFESATLESVVDGDTLWVNVGGESVKVRLIGIDTPESVHTDESRNTPEGVIASDYVKSLLTVGQTLYLQSDAESTDAYGRALRYVWLEVPSDPTDAEQVRSHMLNALLVSEGFAKSFRYAPNTSYAELFDALQAEAVAAGKGVSYLWQD